MDPEFFNKEVESALAVLLQGGVIVYPTDTIWGIGCDAGNEEAIDRIFRIKKRPADKSMIVLVAEDSDILNYVAAPDPFVFDFIKAQERPTTIIFENALGLPGNLIAEDGSVALRLTHDMFCRHLVKRLRSPVVSTSANYSGQPAPAFFKDIPHDLLAQADHVVRWKQDSMEPAIPSRIIKWNSDGTHTIIRA